MYLIVKLLLNSLYGRFGMNLSIFYQKQLIIPNEELIYYFNRGTITNLIELEDDKYFINFQDDHDIDSRYMSR